MENDMFIKNEACTKYFSIVENAKKICPRATSKKSAMSLRGYIEDHHIIPKCLGGSDTINNKVWLTAEEHFICHQLLTEMTEGVANGKMWSALWRMMNKQSHNQERKYTITSEEYAIARENHARNHSIRVSGENNPYYGKKHSQEVKNKMSSKKKGKTYEEIFGAEKAAEMRRRRAEENYNKPKVKQNIIRCPHCDTAGGKGIMKRWHFDNCKHSNNTI